MKVQKKRRREQKTDYQKRIKLLKSGVPRLAFRKTNRYFIIQYITTKEARDKVEFGVNTKKLFDYGWPKEFTGSLKSLPAAYLIGLLAGKMITKKKLQNPIVDFGMQRVIHKSRILAFIKGLVDSGIKIKHKEESFPTEERIKGKHMKKDFSQEFEKIKSKIEKNA